MERRVIEVVDGFQASQKNTPPFFLMNRRRADDVSVPGAKSLMSLVPSASPLTIPPDGVIHATRSEKIILHLATHHNAFEFSIIPLYILLLHVYTRCNSR